MPTTHLKRVWSVISRACSDLPVELSKLERACRSAEPMSQSYIMSAARILNAVASFLILERMATLQADTIPARLNAWLTQHYTEKLDVPALCEMLGIGRSRLYNIAYQMYGCGLLQHVKKLRLEKAKNLLRERPDLSISQIAEVCGFSDYNYFNAVFSKTVGLPPGAYRNFNK